MITIEEKLNLFSKHVFEDIKEIQDEKMKKIEAHNKEQMDKHREKIERQNRQYAEKKIDIIKEKSSKKISQKISQVRRDIMLKKNQLFTNIIEDIKNQLEEFANSSDYKDYLKKSLEKGLCELKNKNTLEIQVSKSDIKNNKDYIKDIVKENGFKEENISIIESEELIIGGAILVDKNNKISLDISLLEKLNENKGYIGNMFYETVDKVGEENGR
ncbi:V-type ATP synthase subunit E [Senegalia sp. (in: firmicutes)]|uniref:V-type ATP synthase subunit E n=1 Tax=Senegalia sp. (in: firmicutes) TaxID=1924098 RepID=UPI003F950EA3